MKLIWDKTGELYGRVYAAKGQRGSYRIDLDQAADRWVIYVNGIRCVDNVYYIKNAQRIVENFEADGSFAIPPGLRPRPDGQHPQVLAADGPTSEALVTSNHPLASTNTQVLPSPTMLRLTARPDPDALAAKLHSLIVKNGISPEPAGTPWLPWQSGVYALVDCIFSSQSKYKSVVLPLISRLATRPTLQDTPDLHFSAFLTDIDGFGANKFERYAVQVLTRNKIAGRLKVEICYNASSFFAKRGLETITDLHTLGAGLEPLVLKDLQAAIHGVGPALAHYLLTLFGDEDHVKLDMMITRFWAKMNDWQPRASHDGDYQIVLAAFRTVASRMGSTPARLDNAIWSYESERV